MSGKRSKIIRKLITDPDVPWPVILKRAEAMGYSPQQCEKEFRRNRGLAYKRIEEQVANLPPSDII